MQHALPLLIDTARAARDQQTAALAHAQQAVQQAASTLSQLQAFRADCLAHSAAGTLGRASGQSLQDYQQFVARLDEAITQQRLQAELRQTQAQAQQARLLQCQQRLLAFETLAKRDAAERAQREQKREQRASDEFAARAAARNATGAAA